MLCLIKLVQIGSKSLFLSILIVPLQCGQLTERRKRVSGEKLQSPFFTALDKFTTMFGDLGKLNDQCFFHEI